MSHENSEAVLREIDGRLLGAVVHLLQRHVHGAAAESFNGKLRNELLNMEILDTLLQRQVLMERWRRHYNTVRPHSALNYRPLALAAGALGLT